MESELVLNKEMKVGGSDRSVLLENRCFGESGGSNVRSGVIGNVLQCMLIVIAMWEL
jgi:hypothetical protein